MNSTWCKATVLIALIASSSVAYGSTGSRAPRSAPAGEPRVVARLVAAASPLIPGEVTDLGVHLDIEPGWHVYWDGINDTGMPVTFSVHFPEGYGALPTLWPAPRRHIAKGGILDHIYEDEVTLIVPVRVPSGAQPGSSITLAMDLEWLVCKNVCLPESGHVEITLPVGRADSSSARTPEAPLFAKTRARLPRPLPADQSRAGAAWQEGALVLTGRPGGRVEFYPGPACKPVLDLIQAGASDDGRLVLQFDEDGPPARAEGIFAVWPAGGGEAEYYRIDLANPVRRGVAPADLERKKDQ